MFGFFGFWSVQHSVQLNIFYKYFTFDKTKLTYGKTLPMKTSLTKNLINRQTNNPFIQHITFWKTILKREKHIVAKTPSKGTILLIKERAKRNFQNDFLGVEKRRWQLSNNSSIPVIQSKQGSFGINYSKNSFLISSEFYYKYISGITTQSQGFTDQFQFEKSSGTNSVYGMDLLLKKSFPNYNIWLSYSYMDNKYTFKSISQNPFPSNFDITHAASFGSSYTKNSFKFSLGLNWHTGKPITEPVKGNEIVNNEINFSQQTLLGQILILGQMSLPYTLLILTVKLKGSLAALFGMFLAPKT